MNCGVLRYVFMASLLAGCLNLVSNPVPCDDLNADPHNCVAVDAGRDGALVGGSGGSTSVPDAATETAPPTNTGGSAGGTPDAVDDAPIGATTDGSPQDAGCPAGQRMCGADCIENSVPCDTRCPTGSKICGAKCVANATCCTNDMPGCGSACKKCQDGACVNVDDATSCGSSQICKAGVCGECGDLNKSCCGNACNAAGTSCQSGTCKACGGGTQPCCGTACNDGFTCKAGVCEKACGDGPGQTCCEDAKKPCKNKCGDEGVVTCRGGKYGKCSEPDPECCPGKTQKCTNTCKVEGTRECGDNGKWAPGCSTDSMACEGGEDQPCRNHGCDAGLYCSPTNFCRPKRGPGGGCSESFECLSGICKQYPGTCTAPDGFLTECLNDVPCASSSPCQLSVKQCV